MPQQRKGCSRNATRPDGVAAMRAGGEEKTLALLFPAGRGGLGPADRAVLEPVSPRGSGPANFP